MKIIACLGNPGRKYRNNRHNIGFLLGEAVAGAAGISLRKKEFSSTTGAGTIAGQAVLMIFPETFMNNSGVALRAAIDYYRETAENIIVIHDEIELPFGEFRLKFGGGHKGHNGLRSIIQHTGTSDFHRLRFGVGRPPHPDMAVADYVLSDFTDDELRRIGEILPAILDALAGLITGA
jgi:PTH1 family peptidyl-tRNA hydrolase